MSYKKGDNMEIKKEDYYVIVKMEKGKVVDYFNSRVYSGKYVMLAYKQIKNSEEYTICKISPKPVK